MSFRQFLRLSRRHHGFVVLSVVYCLAQLCGSTVVAQTMPDAAAAIVGIDADVRRAMMALHSPGVAVGVIVNGKVIIAKGYGVREIGDPAAVDANTLFDIASLTKSFTATLVATMVDAGKLDWDRPVVSYLPWFRMYDPIATQLITPRDLLTHRSGLPRHDFIRYSTYLTREELLSRLQYLEPSSTFRQTYQYSNLMYVVAGYLAGSAAGTSWEDLVKQRLFAPLGMTHSNTSAIELREVANYARPHMLVNGGMVAIPVYDYQKFGIGPNGAINSCINDMMKYIAFQLSDGTLNGAVIVSKKQMLELHKPSTVTNDGNEYALGWVIQDYRGHKVLEHTGSVSGFTSEMAMVPDEGTGIVVLNNSESRLPKAVTNDLLDRLLNLERHDYVAQVLTDSREAEQDAQSLKAKVADAYIPNTKPTLPMSDYTGTYLNPAYGSIRVEQSGDGLVVRFDAINLSLHHYNYDSFTYTFDDRPYVAQFHVGSSAKVIELLLPLEPSVKPFNFSRMEP